MLQDVFEKNLEKRTKTIFIPLNGKKLIAFIDNMNMPAKVNKIKIERLIESFFLRIFMVRNHHLN